jgi:CRISPR-associated protein Cas6
MHIDLAFRLQANQPISADHGFALFGAISRVLPAVHADTEIGVHPIAGRQIGDRQMELNGDSRLVLRIPDGKISAVLPLAGKSLQLGDSRLVVGVPEVRTLLPATAVRSRIVLIKVSGHDATALTADIFSHAARKQLQALGVSEQAALAVNQHKRRTIQVHGRELVGYEVIVEGLSAEESIILQERGLGGKRHMGCGVFMPLR